MPGPAAPSSGSARSGTYIDCVSATVADYAWWSEWRPDWAEAYCVTLVGDMTAEDVVTSLGADSAGSVQGFDALSERVVDGWAGDYDPAQAVLGVSDVDGGWALVVEVNGYVGVTERLIGPMSAGRTIVSHFRNVNAVRRFNWWRNGRLLVDFDTMFPADRFGAEPDAIVDDIRGVGIPLDAETDEILGVDLNAAGFALAQRITGIACTQESFEHGDFHVAVAAMPSVEDQERYVRALHTAWRHPITW